MARRTLTTRSRGGGASRGRQSRRAKNGDDDEIPEVYQQMLAEEEARESSALENDRPAKRRKVAEQTVNESDSQPTNQDGVDNNDDTARPVQTAYDSTASDDDDDESDMEWEEVDIHQTPSNLTQTAPISEGNDEPLQITFDQQKEKGRRITRRKPITGAERKLRLDVHKVHLLCLLRHVQIRNLWCNDEDVQGFLKRMLSKNIISLLNPSEDKPQYSRSTTFMDGLNQASDAFTRRFRVTNSGMKQAHWADDPDSLKQRMESVMSDAEVFLSKEDFQKQAKTLQGSRDFGAQLFCALLRSAAVEARLVCSLQPLPFSGISKNSTPANPESKYIVTSSDDHDTSTDERSKSNTPSTTPQRSRRLGRPGFTPSRPKASVRPSPRPTPRESPYPVFWVEAFNEAVQKWVPVDPLVTKSLAKPSKFEPPASDQYNNMCYVVAFEEDASGRDVTRRYVKAFNAKTRRLRVESTKNGEIWWAKALEFYEKPFLEDRDELEIGELTAKTAGEPMPRNVQDFKSHPIYALERHLHRNEVIFPKRVIGQVGLSKSGPKSQALEPVYRRSDVHTLRSADGWYRLGRDIKLGEQPLKRVRANRSKITDLNDEEGIPEEVETILYANFQTEVYKPPPVVRGKIPKNVYGNLDVYVPSMVPPGGFHITRSDAKQSAKILGIDYADAVTGFEFKGRHGTAVVRGIVIASEYREALEAVIDCLEEERARIEIEGKTAEVLGLWKHFLLRLRIAERVKGYAVEGEDDEKSSAGVSDKSYEEPDDMAGGFFPEPGQETRSPPVDLTTRSFAGQSFYQTLEPESSRLSTAGQEEEYGGGFIPEEPMDDTPDPWLSRQTFESGGSRVPMADQEGENGGGFIPEDPMDDATDTAPIPGNSASSTETMKTQPTNQSHFTLVVVPSDGIRPKHNGDSGINVASKSADAMQVTSNMGTEDPAEDADKNHGDTPEAPKVVESSAGNSKSASDEAFLQDTPQPHPSAHSPQTTEKESDNDEQGSLLSEDPDDEDAIPEWLM